MATVRIPTPLRSYTQNKEEVIAAGTTVREVLNNLEASYPGIGARLLDDKGGVRRYVNIFHNDEDIRFLQALDTPVTDSDKLSIIPAIAGGALPLPLGEGGGEGRQLQTTGSGIGSGSVCGDGNGNGNGSRPTPTGHVTRNRVPHASPMPANAPAPDPAPGFSLVG